MARQIALAAGLPVTVPGMSLDRQCASGLMGIATAAKQVIYDHQKMAVGGGLESISLVQNPHMNLYRMKDEALLKQAPHIYMSMLETARWCRAAMASRATVRTNTPCNPSNARPRLRLTVVSTPKSCR